MTLRRMPLIETPDRDSLRTIGGEWESLRRGSSATGVFTTWAWMGAWLDTVGRDADLEVVTARDPDSGRLFGLAPFVVNRVIRRHIPLRALQFVGAGPTAPDHLDLLVHEEAPPGTAQFMWDAVLERRRWDFIDFEGVIEDGHLSNAVLRREADAAQLTPCPYLPLDDGWDALEAGFSGRLRNNLTRYGKKLDREATVEEWMVTNREDLDATLDHLIRFHQAVRTAKGDAGVFAGAEQRAFLRTAAHRLLDAGRLRMWRLDADGMPIAVIWCARSGDEVAFYTTGYDPEWARLGPGRRIMARAIRGAVDEGAAVFDFLRGDEPYKQEWGTEVRHDLVIRRATSPRGRLLATVERAARKLLGRATT